MKEIYYLIISLSLFSASAYGQQKSDSTHKPDSSKSKPQRPDLLRKIPPPVGWINDYAFLFTNEEVGRLDSVVSNFEKKTTIEIAVLTLDSTRTNAKDFDEFTMLIGNTWGVGKEDADNGILIAISADLRRIRIHNGHGIKKVLPDEKTKEIIDTVFIPLFKDGKLFEGTMQGILAIIKALPSHD